jgi:hypothetical protein
MFGATGCSICLTDDLFILDVIDKDQDAGDEVKYAEDNKYYF